MKRKVVLFCGGRGAATIIYALLEDPDVDLTLIVNAYDDGASTGALRLLIPGMLGPSDFRKNISYLLDLTIPQNEAVRDLVESRVYHHTLGYIQRDPYLWFLLNATGDLRLSLLELLDWFWGYVLDWDPCFDFWDCSVGNMIFAGAYLKMGSSFNGAVRYLSDLFGLRAKLVNVSQGECCVLQSLKEDGTFLPDEASIVGTQSNSPIIASYLVTDPVTPFEMDSIKRPDTYWECVMGGTWLERRGNLLASREAKVELSLEAAEAIREADMIIYGPGTQHSSLLPSYRIAGKALGVSKAPIKALIVNLEHDNDTQNLTGSDLVNDALFAMGGVGTMEVLQEQPWITHILYNVPQPNRDKTVQPGALYDGLKYRGALILAWVFDSDSHGYCHRGSAVVDLLIGCQDSLL